MLVTSEAVAHERTGLEACKEVYHLTRNKADLVRARIFFSLAMGAIAKFAFGASLLTTGSVGLGTFALLTLLGTASDRARREGASLLVINGKA
jgi:hypothetical protein